jgi:hypothetical protein
MEKQLFEGDNLYCTGRNRPWMRGKLHIIASLTAFPMFLYYFYKSACNNSWALTVGMTNVIIVYLAHIISSIYHTLDVSKETEILLQKIDIIGSNWYIGSSYFPMALLLFPKGPGYLLAFLAVTIALWNSYCVWISDYSIVQPLYIVALQIPFFYYIYNYMTTYELTCNFVGIGALFFAGWFLLKDPKISFFDESICTSYEIYHSLSVVCFMAILLMNYSIVCRMTNSTNYLSS